MRAMQIHGRIAVVTGASGGIGSALVEALVVAGASRVVATDLVGDGLARLVAAYPDIVVARALDVVDDNATRALVDEIESSIGPVDLWFANAGIGNGGGPDASDEVWNLQWQVNVMAHVYAARALLPGWLARGEGHLVTTASLAGILTTLGDGVYSATKHAAVGWAEWLAITYGNQGVQVSCVCPGAVDTAMLRAAAGSGNDDATAASAAIGGGEVIVPAVAASRILAGVQEDRFLIYTHPEFHDLVVRKFQEPDRWIKGMRKLWSRTGGLQ